MPENIAELNVGDILSNGDVVRLFQVGNMGGMRRSRKTNTLVIVSDPFKGFYDDRWEENTLHYTGMGKVGDQSIESTQNKTLANSNSNGIQVHLFEVFKPKEYTYMGEVKLIGEPYQQVQEDTEGVNRNVWVFPLQHVAPNHSQITIENLHSREALRESQIHAASDEEVRNKAAKSGTKNPSKRTTSATTAERNPWVSEYAKRRANGHCELCKLEAPFQKKSGESYLEVHHIQWLSKGGADTIDNTVALCPNCHRKMHSLNLREDQQILEDLEK